MTWWLKLGGAGTSLEMPSGTGIQKLDSSETGLVAGAGLKYQIFPETIVSAGMCLDFGITFLRNKFDRYSSAAETGIVDNDFQEIQAQVAYIISRQYGFPVKTRPSSATEISIEPYGGVALARDYVRLSDRNSLAWIDGEKYGLSAVLGAKVRLSKMEHFFLEYSFLEEDMLTAGFSFGF